MALIYSHEYYNKGHQSAALKFWLLCEEKIGSVYIATKSETPNADELAILAVMIVNVTNTTSHRHKMITLFITASKQDQQIHVKQIILNWEQDAASYVPSQPLISLYKPRI